MTEWYFKVVFRDLLLMAILLTVLPQRNTLRDV
jgi:hypothetical protein